MMLFVYVFTCVFMLANVVDASTYCSARKNGHLTFFECDDGKICCPTGSGCCLSQQQHTPVVSDSFRYEPNGKLTL